MADHFAILVRNDKVAEDSVLLGIQINDPRHIALVHTQTTIDWRPHQQETNGFRRRTVFSILSLWSPRTGSVRNGVMIRIDLLQAIQALLHETWHVREVGI